MKTLCLLSLVLLFFSGAAAQSKHRIPYLENEKWWGAATDLGPFMPFAPGTDAVIDLSRDNFNNQTSPLLLSNRGRYIWADEPMVISFDSTAVCISVVGNASPVIAQSDDRSLRGAYREVRNRFFKPDSVLPPSEFFSAPIYNTWIELMYNQNQADILKYAADIISHGFPPGILMIDDNWQQDYGVWEFRPDRFPCPKEMVDSLHNMGFKVMLWVCPFVSPDSKEARDLNALGYLVKARGSDDMAVMRWWNGHSACYDFSNPGSRQYFKNRLTDLQTRYGIDGFKFDGGDPERYDSTKIEVFDKKSYGTAQTGLWAELAAGFPYNELRACWQMGNRALVQRLGDKPYSWDGVARLVPCMISAGLLGHSYACPDMIGGGEYTSFLNIDSASFDPSLIIRSCQIHAAMPMMQFSVAPWRILNDADLAVCRDYALLHCQLADYITLMAEKTAVDGTPIVRHMSYSFPGEGFDDIKDQYMLGDRWLIAPVTNAENSRSVRLPKGLWRDELGKTYKGGRTITLSDIPITRLPRFERIR